MQLTRPQRTRFARCIDLAPSFQTNIARRALLRAALAFGAALSAPRSSSASAPDDLVREAGAIVAEAFDPSRGRSFARSEFEQRVASEAASVASFSDAHSAIERLINSLSDPYSRWLPERDFESLLKFDVSGVGVNFTQDPNSSSGLRVLGVVQGSPAEFGGVCIGDELLAIDGSSVSNLSAFQAASQIRSTNKPSISLTLRHHPEWYSGSTPSQSQQWCAQQQDPSNNSSSEAILSKRNNTTIPASTVSYRMYGDGVAYIRVRELNSVAAANVEDAVKKLSVYDPSMYILDLRNNLGGLLSAGVEIANLFLPQNSVIVNTVGRSDASELKRGRTIMSDRQEPITKKPLVVRVNGRSASASEILSGALQDNCRAILVGKRTFGKALIQSVYELSDGSGMVLTTGRYMTPQMQNIDQTGLEPSFSRMPEARTVQDMLRKCNNAMAAD